MQETLPAMPRSRRVPDQTGQKYGRLTVIADDGRKIGNRRAVEAVCECGVGPFDVRLGNLRTGRSRSCGCLLVEGNGARNRTHGLSDTALYSAWESMKRRCSSSAYAAVKYPNYVNVNVCDEWQTFEGFLRCPPDGEFIPRATVLGRYGDVGDYSPTNARWTTKRENGREANLELFIDGEPAADVAVRSGVKPHTMYARVHKGWDVRSAATTPAHFKGGSKYYIDGELAVDVARRNGVDVGLMYGRLDRGWPLLDAATLPPGTRRKKSEK